ncbi:uncharacterized protein LOC100116417 [Nasonia vitripennis]|uniref:THAP-type domain-containing protein n=1 Tax=Nasonia vitripennis TaxID=7425 RepID=A0A7M7QLN7_NASVI|nr:uncharacterized protein LOC100116417 [Nasonia vitripennis]
MPLKCCIPNCKLQKDDPGCLNLSFFTVPSNQNTRNEWLRRINKYFNMEMEFKKYSYVCSLHFEQSCFNYGGLSKTIRLKKGSCPTIFEKHSLKENHEPNIIEMIEIDQDNPSSDRSINIFNEGCVDDSQPNLSKNAAAAAAMLSSSTGTDDEVNLGAKSHFGSVRNDSLLDHTVDTIGVAGISQANELQDDGHADSSDDLITSSMVSEMSEMDESSTNFVKMPQETSLLKKSLANINIESIDFSNENFLRKLLLNAQSEIRNLRRCRRVQAMRLYRAKKRIRSSISLISHMKNRKLISDKVSEFLNDSVPAQARDIFQRLLQKPN